MSDVTSLLIRWMVAFLIIFLLVMVLVFSFVRRRLQSDPTHSVYRPQYR